MESLEHNAYFFITHSDTALMIEPGHRMLDHDAKNTQPGTMGIVHGLCQKRLNLAHSDGVDVGPPTVTSIQGNFRCEIEGGLAFQ